MAYNDEQSMQSTKAHHLALKTGIHGGGAGHEDRLDTREGAFYTAISILFCGGLRAVALFPLICCQQSCHVAASRTSNTFRTGVFQTWSTRHKRRKQQTGVISNGSPKNSHVDLWAQSLSVQCAKHGRESDPSTEVQRSMTPSAGTCQKQSPNIASSPIPHKQVA